MQAGALEGKRVLIAEDCWHIAFSLKTVLEGEGVAVVGPAATVARSCRLLAAEAIDLALVDFNLRGEMAWPLLDGLAARGIRCIVVSGYRNIAGLDETMVTQLGKPVRPGRLLGAMRSAMACAV